ncbi:unnamed protein product [Symbiodinium sp. CCMP2592]|nr:unnamed protein product [Symbiodinium sp. CCMP2592]
MAFDADTQSDVRERKFFECRWWCMTMARAGRANFAESDVYDIVSANLRDLFLHCRDVDASVRRSAHHVIWAHAAGSHHFVQQIIADVTLGLMDNLLPEPAELVECSEPLEFVIRALTKPQRQKWVSLLVRVLEVLQGQSMTAVKEQAVMEHLAFLWWADEDPRGSY